MPLTLSFPIASLPIQRHLTHSSEQLSMSYQKAASGERIQHAGDDAAGLAISENLRAQVRSLGQAHRNINDGISYIQVAEGGMTEINDMVIRLRELAIQAASDTIGKDERNMIQVEVNQLLQEINRQTQVTQFNGTYLLNGKADQSVLSFQVGIHNDPNGRIQFSLEDLDIRTSKLGIDSINMTSIDGARESLESIDKGLTRILRSRAELGALQTRLQSSMKSLEINKENLSIARSRIADTDLAHESSQIASSSILQAAGVAVLAQANQQAAQVLHLIA